MAARVTLPTQTSSVGFALPPLPTNAHFLVALHASKRVSPLSQGQSIFWSGIWAGGGGSWSGCTSSRQPVWRYGVQAVLHDNSGGSQQGQELPLAVAVDNSSREQDPAPQCRDQLPAAGERQCQDQI